jgi:hypothetical protein
MFHILWVVRWERKSAPMYQNSRKTEWRGTYQQTSDPENRIGRLLRCVVEGELIVRSGCISANVRTEALDCSTFMTRAQQSAIQGRIRRTEDEVEGS